jgi:hypothetical protein
MGDHSITTPAEPEVAVLDGELIAESAPAFLPLAARRVLYVLALAGAAAAPVVALSHPELSVAIVTSAGILNVAALGTALANPSR